MWGLGMGRVRDTLSRVKGPRSEKRVWAAAGQRDEVG